MGAIEATETVIHVFTYPTHAVTVVLHIGTLEGDLPAYADATADGGAMVVGWYYHHTTEHAHNSVAESVTLARMIDQSATVVHHTV